MKKNEEVKLQNVYRKIVFSFIALTAILILVILYFSFNKAIISIIPAKEPVDVDFAVKVEETPSDQTLGVIKGQVFETIVEDTEKFSASGSKILQTGVGGKATIFNNSSNEQTLIATTRLLTPDNILFRTKKTITVPAGGKTEVEIYADNPNLAMEILPTKFIIPGLWSALQDKIYAESYESLSGSKKEVTVISESDLDEAKKSLTEDLINKSLEEFKTKLGDKDISWKIATTIYELASSIDGKLNEPKEEFTLGLKLKVGGVAFDNEKLLTLAEDKLKNTLPDDKELIEINGDSFKYIIKKYDLNNKRADLDIHLDGTAVIRENNSIFDKNKLIGLTKGQVEAYLKNFDAIEGFKVEFTPPWVFKVPKLKDHIIIQIEK